MKTLLEFDYRKAVQAINFFAKKEGGEIDKLKVIKLIWLSDRLHLRQYGRPIVNDTYVAMKLGPVGSAVKDLTEASDFLPSEERQHLEKFLQVHVKKNSVSSLKDVDTDVLSETDLEALEKVYVAFGKYAPITLSVRISHLFPEWKRFETSLKTSSRENMNYEDFFKDIENPGIPALDIFNQSKEDLILSKKIFEENYMTALFW